MPTGSASPESLDSPVKPANDKKGKPLPFFKIKLKDISKQLYLENGWEMPRGLMDSKARDPRNFTLAEWQQAKRAGLKAGELKAAIQECWAVSDNRQSFAKALEERGLFLAKGDRRGHVAVSYDGQEAFSIARMIGKKAKEVTAKIGKPDDLRSVADTRTHIANEIMPRLKSYVAEAKSKAAKELASLEQQRQAMKAKHQMERQKMDAGQEAREEAETRARAARLRKGLAGIWDRLRGEYSRLRKKNEMEAHFALLRDREQRHAMVEAQLKERRELQGRIRLARQRHAGQLRQLHKDRTNYRLMQRGEAPKVQDAFIRLEALRNRPTPQQRAQTRSAAKPRMSTQERLNRLRQGRSHEGPEPDLER